MICKLNVKMILSTKVVSFCFLPVKLSLAQSHGRLLAKPALNIQMISNRHLFNHQAV